MPISPLLNFSNKILTFRAFLHWYQKYGMTSDDLMEMFYKYDRVLSYYDEL